jgi:hypothetical protein
MAYSADIKAEARRLITWHGYTAELAAEHFDGAPAASTIDNWARSDRDEDGRNWYEQREQATRDRFDVTRPEHIGRDVIAKIHEVLSQPGFDANRADQLAKLSKHLRQFVDPQYHVSMTFQVLTRFLAFTKKHYPGAATAELVRAVRDFKAQERSKIEG